MPDDLPLALLQGGRPFIEHGWPLATEFFLNATACGALAISAVRSLSRGEGARRQALVGAALGLGLILAASGLLFLDLGQPLRVWHLWVMPNPRSPLTWGTGFLSLFPLLAAAHLGALLGRRRWLLWLSAGLGLPLAMATQGYTAFVLLMTHGRPVWGSPMLPPVFLVSSLAAGAAAILLLEAGWERLRGGTSDPESTAELGGLLRHALLALVCVTGLALGLLALGREEDVLALELLGDGLWLWLGVGGALALGQGLPMLLLAFARGRRRLLLAAAALVLFGALCLRWTIVVGGQALPLAGLVAPPPPPVLAFPALEVEAAVASQEASPWA